MNSRVGVLVLFLVLSTALASAAASIAEEEKEVIRPDQQNAFYTENRWIALRKEGLLKCPTVAGWQEDSLLDLASGHCRGAAAIHRHHELVLDRLCVYTREPSSAKPFLKPSSLVAAERDRMAMTGMAPTPLLGPIGDPSWETLAAHFLDQTGQVRLDSTGAPRVRLVFIDTHRTEEWPLDKPREGKPWHGYTMAHLAHEIMCGDGKPCPIEIATRLALRYDEYYPDMKIPLPELTSKDGGNRGSVNDLALAILEEVHYWETTRPNTKLVLNLSVGWDGEIPDLKASKVSQLEPSVLAVYEALRYARHQGVLVIAAAGNQRGGKPDTEWPVLPAAWELYRPSWWPFYFHHKLVYAVGGVDWQGLPLSNSRHQGHPRRAAYADHAVARTGFGGEPTKMYTGTSVSTAVASSIAAVLWHLRPGLHPAEVMRLMGKSADILDTQADFYAWKHLPFIPAPSVRRLSLCESVLRICGPAGSPRCDSMGLIDCRLGKYPAADLSSINLKPTTTSFAPPSHPRYPPCDENAQLFRGTGPEAQAAGFCPMEALPDLTKPGWVGPQPGDNPCPTCTIVPEPPRVSSLGMAAAGHGYALLVDIDPEWKGGMYGTITGAILAVDCYEDGSSTRVSLDLASTLCSSSTSTARISLGSIGDRESLVGCTASIDFSVRLDREREASRSVQSPVYVDP